MKLVSAVSAPNDEVNTRFVKRFNFDNFTVGEEERRGHPRMYPTGIVKFSIEAVLGNADLGKL